MRSAAEATKLITPGEAGLLVKRGNTVMVGGFGLSGKPMGLVAAVLSNPEATGLTIVSNNLGEPGIGLGRLLLEGRIAKAIGSYFTTNPDVVAAYLAGQLEVELTPQGTLCEAIRAGGAGIAGFYVRTAAGTELAEGRETRTFDGMEYVFWGALHADVALIRAAKADAYGNLVYDKTARNFNPEMAMAANLVVAEVDEIVPIGMLDPEAIITPHPLVDHLVLSRVERR